MEFPFLLFLKMFRVLTVYLRRASRQNTQYSMTLAAILESSEAVGLADPDSRTLAPTRLGLANKAYFQPNPMNSMGLSPKFHFVLADPWPTSVLPLRGLIFNQRVPSQIITTNLLSTEEIQELFDLYFAHLHPHYSVLCPEVHTASATSLRSPFLFSCSTYLYSTLLLLRLRLTFPTPNSMHGLLSVLYKANR